MQMQKCLFVLHFRQRVKTEMAQLLHYAIGKRSLDVVVHFV